MLVYPRVTTGSLTFLAGELGTKQVRDAKYHRQKWKRREYVMLHSARMLVGGDGPCALSERERACSSGILFAYCTSQISI